MQDNQHEEITEGGDGEENPAPSLRDELAAAMNAASDSDDAASDDGDEQNTTTQDNEQEPEGAEASAEDGRGAKEADSGEDESEADQPTDETSASEETETYPKSWNAEARKMFRELPPQAREYILRREREQEQGVQKLKQQYEAKSQFADEMWGAIAPYQQMFQAEGTNPAAAVQNLLNMAAIMRTGTPEQKRDLLIKTAQDFGVDLMGDGTGAAPVVDPALSTLHNEVTTLKQQLIAQQQAQMQAQQQELVQEIEKFRADKPYFDEVQHTMGQLLDAGIASDLDDAYERAIRINDDVWQRVQADREKQKAAEAAAKAKERAKKAKRAAASISGAPGAAGSGSPGPKRDLREEIAAQFAAASGRV